MPSHPRAFIRHPVEIPIEVATQSEPGHLESLKDLSFGGLSFGADQSYKPGTLLGIWIKAPTQPVKLAARVAWCRRRSGRHAKDDNDLYEVGVAFEDHLDAFRIRMVQQVCQIERYRLSVLNREGRELTAEEAAREWIARYAGRFFPQE